MILICQKCRQTVPPESVYCLKCGKKLTGSVRPKTKRGNGQGSAYRRNGSWTARWTVDKYVDSDGKFHQIRHTKAGFATKKDALDYCAQRTDLPDRIAPRLIDYWRQYEETRLPELSKDKQTAYRIAWKRWEPEWYSRVDTITSADLCRAVAAATSTHYPARDMKSLMTNLFRLIGADGFASKDLPSYIPLPKLEESKREPFTDLEQAALWKAWEAGCFEAALPLTMIYTGMMPSEMMGLQADMIDLDARTITGAGRKTAVRKAATVYLPAAILPVLESVLAKMRSDRRSQPFPRSEDKFYEEYYKSLTAANVRRLTPYSCRHTTATALAVTAGIAPNTVKEIMRWSTTRMLDRYAHPSRDDLLAAADNLKK